MTSLSPLSIEEVTVYLKKLMTRRFHGQLVITFHEGRVMMVEENRKMRHDEELK